MFADLNMDDLKPAWMRTPLWRWCEAHEYMANPTRRFPSHKRDFYLHSAAVFLNLISSNRRSARLHLRKNLPLANAHQLFHESALRGGARWQVEGFILGGASDEQINELLPMPSGPAAYEYYRKLFFDIDEYLDNQHAILAKVFSMGLARNHEMADCDLTWKMLAYELGWEKFCGFLTHYRGGEAPGELKQFLRDFREVRMLYYMHHRVNDMRLAFQERTIAMMQTASSYYQIDQSAIDAFGNKAARQTMQELLEAVAESIGNAERKIRPTATERVRSGTETIVLAPEDVEVLETVYEDN